MPAIIVAYIAQGRALIRRGNETKKR